MSGIGKKLAAARVNIGLTQEEVAEKTNNTKNNIKRYESGEKEPDLKTLIDLCKLYKISADQLLNIEEGKNIEIEGEQIQSKFSGSHKISYYYKENEMEVIVIEKIHIIKTKTGERELSRIINKGVRIITKQAEMDIARYANGYKK